MIILEEMEWLLRLVEEKDQYLLAKWLSDPQVLEFYEGRDRPFDLRSVNQEFIEMDDHLERCIIEYKGVPIGYLQMYPLDEETQAIYGISGDALYGMDQFIGEPSYWNKGLGTDLIKVVTDYLFSEKNAKAIYMDPQLRNPRALRCYEKAGFEKVKFLPEHELHEGKYQDCWLIRYKK